MIKTAFAPSHWCFYTGRPAAFAGPYVNVETNAGWTGSDYTTATQISMLATKVLSVLLVLTMSKVALV